MAKLKLPFELEKPSSNEYVTQSSQIGHNGQPLDDVLEGLDSISKEATQSEDEEFVASNDAGTDTYAKVGSYGVKAKAYKKLNGDDAIPPLDTTIGDNPSNSHTPSSKAVKDYVDSKQIDLPITEETSQSETEEQVWGNNAETQEYAKIGSYGMKSKAYLDMSGNSVIPVKDTAIGEIPSQANVPTSKAVADYVAEHGGGDLPIEKEATQEDEEAQTWGNNEGTDTYAKIDNTGLSAKNINILDDCLVVYNGTQLAIYKNILGTNKYIEYSIVHVYSTDTDPSHVPDNADYWRLSTSYVCSRRGKTFTRLYKCLDANENEFVVLLKNAPDYTGGYHGDEKYTDIHFFLDGEELDLTSSFTKKGHHFEYIITSNMYDTATDITEILAVHYKHTIIDNNGFTTQNRIIFQKSSILTQIFAGLCCVAKDVASKWFAEDLVVHTCVGDSSSIYPDIKSKEPVVCFMNPTNGVRVNVSSRVIYGVDPELLVLSVWDRSGDTKYYYRSPGNNTLYNVANGDEYKVEMKYQLML